MNNTIAVTVCLCLLSACTSFSEVKQEHLGFIRQDIPLEKVETPDSLSTFRWISPKLSDGHYQAVNLKPVKVLNPQGEYLAHDSEIYEELSQYMHQALSEAIAPSLPLVSTQQDGVLDAQVAISALRVTDADLKPTEVLPFGAVMGITRSLTGLRNKDVELYLEVKLIDSISGELVGALIKQGVAGELWTSYESLTLADLQPTIDAWATHVMHAFSRYVKRQYTP